MKTVLFVPGFHEDLTNTRDYQGVMRAIERRGYQVVFVPIQWKRTTILDWVRELEAVYEAYDPAQTVLAGFSFGSMAAFMVAAKRNPAELWLCSFSPYFSDDMPKMKKFWLATIGKRRAEVFRSLEFGALADDIQCKTMIFLGEVEAKKYPIMMDRAVCANREIGSSSLIIVPGADHDVADPNYIAAIEAAV